MHHGCFPSELMVLADVETTSVVCHRPVPWSKHWSQQPQLSFRLCSRVDSGGDILLIWRTVRKTKKDGPLLLPVVGRASVFRKWGLRRIASFRSTSCVHSFNFLNFEFRNNHFKFFICAECASDLLGPRVRCHGSTT